MQDSEAMARSQRYNSFVVRIWRERGGSAQEQEVIWKGWVQHVLSGESVYVQNVDELLAFMERWTGQLGSPGTLPKGLK